MINFCFRFQIIPPFATTYPTQNTPHDEPYKWAANSNFIDALYGRSLVAYNENVYFSVIAIFELPLSNPVGN